MLRLFLFLICISYLGNTQPISLDATNPHYFNYKGKILPLVTSGEHYGAVLNLDFDYITYLNTLQKDGLNYTRIFSGAYVEQPGAFNITENTLAPPSQRMIVPWARTAQEGYRFGGNKFDLNKWDEAYFERLKDFVKEAGKRDIIVEVTLFSSMYTDNGWLGSPLNAINNISHTDSVKRQDVHTLLGKSVNQYQLRMVQKIVQSLNSFDNVFYEIQNEPWADNGEKVGNTKQPDPTSDAWMTTLEIPNKKSLDWQRLMVNTINITEKFLPKKHLIAQNFANFHQKLDDIKTSIPRLTNIYNFHYNHVRAAQENYHLKKVLGFDESGFAGSADSIYRRQAWRWMLAGGGLFNNLDYSFTVKTPAGITSQKAPGGGSVALRRQLGFLKKMIENMALKQAKPDTTLAKTDKTNVYVHTLTDTEKHLFYIESGQQTTLQLNLPPNSYLAQWYDPKTGDTVGPATVLVSPKTVKSPTYKEDIVLLLHSQ